MNVRSAAEKFHGLFRMEAGHDGQPRLTRADGPMPHAVPDPATGHPLRVGRVEGPSPAICPKCDAPGHGGFVSFVADLRLAYACPTCEQLVWLAGS